MKRLIFTFALMMISTAVFGQIGDTVAKSEGSKKIVPNREIEDEVRVLLVKAVFEWPDVMRKRNRYLRIDDNRKPSKFLRKRLKAEGCDFSSSWWKKGVRVWISKLSWTNDSEVEASAGYEAGNMAGGSCNYKLIRVQGLWNIVSKDNCLIS